MGMSSMSHAKAKNDSAVAGASEHWAEMPVVAGYLFVRIITSTRNVVGMGIKRNFPCHRSVFVGFGRPYGSRET